MQHIDDQMNCIGKDTQELRVSVIIPVYNVEPYIEEALDSVIGQNYYNLEILLIDDGSTDMSGPICDRYARKDSRIRVFHQTNRGLSAARNIGLNHAKGELIAFLDPDDAFVSYAIKKLVEKLKEYDADVAICDFATVKAKGHMSHLVRRDGREILYNREEMLKLIAHGAINTAVWNKIYTKDVWDELRFPVGQVYEGSAVVFSIFDRVQRTIVVKEKLVLHRLRKGSICHTCSLKSIQDGRAALEREIEYVSSHTPELFTESDLERLKRTRIYSAIANYLWFIMLNPRDLHGRELLRETLRDTGTKENLYVCEPIVRFFYYVTKACPYVAAAAYFPYHYAINALRYFQGR